MYLSRDLDFHGSVYKDILDRANSELWWLEEVFSDFLNRIRTEKPDILIFLDKSARVFGTPFLKYLKRLERVGEMEKAPEIRFYNDHDLKMMREFSSIFQSIEPYRTEFVGRVREDFGDLQEKKIFFVDEAFALDRGVEVVSIMGRILSHQNLWYFAFSNEWWEFERQEAMKNPHYIIYPWRVINFPMRIGRGIFDDLPSPDGKKTTTVRRSDPYEDDKIRDVYVRLHDRILDTLERADAPNRIPKAAE